MSTEDAFTDRLSDYVDGEDLDPVERAAIEAHLGTCAACRTTLSELRAVAARAASLPDDSPAADLWPGIADRLDSSERVVPFVKPSARRFSFTLPQLVAAGLALMVLSGGMVWFARHGGLGSSLPQVTATNEITPDISEAAGGAAPLRITQANFADAQYDQAIADLEKALEAGRSRLDPETVRILEANLSAIDAAIAQCRKALRNDPANVYLNNHFAESRQRKLALLRRASALAMADHEVGAGS
jgi:tetratricopeptide (TPR) repeat protein